MGIKNLFELEGVIDSQELCFRFLNISIPIFPRDQVVVKLGEKKLIPIEALFAEEISDKVCEEFNKMVEMVRHKEERDRKKERWLEDMDERKYMADREILDKYINLKNSCLDEVER